MLPLRLPGCCPEHYDPATGSCTRCWFCYDPAAWARHCREAAQVKSQAPDALPGQWLFPGFPQAAAPAPSAPAQAATAGERHCLHCGTLFPFTRSTAEYCKPACRAAAARERARHAAACQYCGAEKRAPFCNAWCQRQAEKEERLSRHGGRITR